METLSYQQFIDEINNGKIVKAVFQVKDYTRYKYCTIEREENILQDGRCQVSFPVKLAKNYNIGQYGYVYGNFLFFGKFEEDCKLFKMGRKGTFTLKQMWDRIEFISIDYAS